MNLSNSEVKLLYNFIISNNLNMGFFIAFTAAHPEWKYLARKIREEFNEIIEKELKQKQVTE